MAPRWHSTRLLVGSLSASVAFYTRHFGMSVIYRSQDPCSCFLAVLRPGVVPPSETASAEARSFLFRHEGTFLELLEAGVPGFKANSGNEEPFRGFGHIAFNVPDVAAACAVLEAAGVTFKKKPDEGRMKGLAFVYDPDGYWIEIVGGAEHHPPLSAPPPNSNGVPAPSHFYNLSQTMIRIASPAATLPFYEALGLVPVRVSHFEAAQFSLYFLAATAHLPPADQRPDPNSDAARDFTKSLWTPVLELTHNHGDYQYHNGVDLPPGADPLTVRGFQRLLFVSEGSRPAIEGVQWDDDNVGHTADPDGYRVDIHVP